MDDWKNKLLISLRQDLLGLTNLAKEIRSCVPNANITSWLFPTKLGADVIAGNISNYSDCNKYLEFIVECIYHVSNLFIIYMDSEISRKNFISTPKNMTLAGSMALLWKLTTQLKESFNIKRADKSNNNHQDQSTQTDENTERVGCDTCIVALASIKEITKSFEAASYGVATKRVKKEIQLNLCDYTVVGCISKLCGAIDEDVENVVRQNCKLLDECSRQNAELMKTQDVLADNAKLTKENTTMSSTVAQLNRTMEQYKNCVGDLRDEIVQVKSEVVKLKEERQTILKGISNKDILMYGLNATVLRLEGAVRDLQEAKTSADRSTAASVKVAANAVAKKFEEVVLRLMDAENGFIKRLDFIEWRVAGLKKSAKNGCADLQMSKRDGKREEHSKIPSPDVQGNPLDDMVKQIDNNVETIRRIQADNDTLMKTVKRLKRMSVHGAPDPLKELM